MANKIRRPDLEVGASSRFVSAGRQKSETLIKRLENLSGR